jgi:4-carboxymuconolactone decarboxylase
MLDRASEDGIPFRHLISRHHRAHPVDPATLPAQDAANVLNPRKTLWRSIMASARETGRKLLAKTLGDDYLKRRDESTNAFNAPLREFSETAAFGMVWSRDHIEPKFRSMLCMAMLTALNRPHELGLHLQSAINNGCTVEEIRETLMHTVPYCGIPATLDAFNVAERVLTEKGLLPMDEDK